MAAEQLISVIVPVYQAERFLDRCVTSLLKQTYEKIEILLIDDGSKDRSLEKCLEWQSRDERVKVLHHENRGVGYTRNRGITQSKGEFFCFLDSDDYLEHNAIECMQKEMNDTDADLCICGYTSVFEQKTIKYVPEMQGVMKKEELIKKAFWQLYDSHILHNIGTKLYKKSTLIDHQVRFREEHKIFEDIMFCLEFLIAAEKVALTACPLYYYMQDNENSVTKGYKEGYLSSAFALNELLAKVVKERDQYFYRNIVVNMYEAYINEFMRETIDKRHIIRQGKALCNRTEILNSKSKFLLGKLKKDARVFCILVWSKCYVGLYMMGLWKRFRRRGKYNYDKAS